MYREITLRQSEIEDLIIDEIKSRLETDKYDENSFMIDWYEVYEGDCSYESPRSCTVMVQVY